MKGYEIPESSRTSRGTNIVNLLQLNPGEQITAAVAVKNYDDDKYLFMATKNGIVKKTKLSEYSNVRKTGLAAITLKDGDELIQVKITDNSKDIFLVTKLGMCIRFNETDVRSTGRTSMGVIGMNLIPGDEVIGMQLNTQGTDLLFVSEHGMGKRTDMYEFSPQHRGGKGVKCYKIMERTGELIGAKAINDDNEIMLISNEGTIIRMMVDNISRLGRNTSGVKLFNLNEDDFVKRITKVRESATEEYLAELERQMNEDDNGHSV
jgi:DNA gyrase subunit A